MHFYISKHAGISFFRCNTSVKASPLERQLPQKKRMVQNPVFNGDAYPLAQFSNFGV